MIRYWNLFPEMAALVDLDSDHSREHVGTYGKLRRTCGLLDDWPETVGHLQPDGTMVDCLSISSGMDIYSTRMRKLIDELVPEGEVQWLPATVVDPDGASHDYWVVNPLIGPEDLLDPEHSVTTDLPVPQPLIKATYRAEVLAGHHMVRYPYGVTPVVSQTLLDTLVEHGITGLAPEPMSVH